MKLVVGLGNPGSKYQGTRHNIGFEVVDRLAAGGTRAAFARKFDGLLAEIEIDYRRVLLLKPETFMNLSGRSVGQAVRFYKLEPAGHPGRLRRPEPAPGQAADPARRAPTAARKGSATSPPTSGPTQLRPAPHRHRRPGRARRRRLRPEPVPQPRTCRDRRRPDPRLPGRRRLGHPGHRRRHEPIQWTREVAGR